MFPQQLEAILLSAMVAGFYRILGAAEIEGRDAMQSPAHALLLIGSPGVILFMSSLCSEVL
jgi:hypothetical protein